MLSIFFNMKTMLNLIHFFPFDTVSVLLLVSISSGVSNQKYEKSFVIWIKLLRFLYNLGVFFLVYIIFIEVLTYFSPRPDLVDD